jgi:hypothetical protein
LVGEKNQARRKISGGPAESAEQATRVRFRDSRFLVYFALDSRRKSFRRRQNNATFLAIESEACATSTRAGVLCGVSRRSRTMSLTNVTEDLSGLSRAELVYKAKLAEQAERCVRPLLVSISAFPPSRVACGRRTEENLSVWRAGAVLPPIGSGFGGTERATAVARNDPRAVREPVSGGASDRAARAPRRPGSRARSHGFFAHRAHRQLEPRHQLERGARGRRRGPRARPARAVPSLAVSPQPRSRVKSRRSAPTPPRGGVRHREAVPPRGPARLGTRRSVNARDKCVVSRFFCSCRFSRRRRRRRPFPSVATHRLTDPSRPYPRRHLYISHVSLKQTATTR